MAGIIAASDNGFVLIGAATHGRRICVACEANGVVTKLTATRTTNNTIALVSDYASGGLSFEQGSAHVAQQVPASLTTAHINAGSTAPCFCEPKR